MGVLNNHYHLSIKLLSHLKIKEDLDSDYEEEQFAITRGSVNACFFLFRVELFSRYTKVGSKMYSSTLSELKVSQTNAV